MIIGRPHAGLEFRAGSSAVEWANAAPLVERLRRIPSDCRAYACSEEDAAHRFGIDRAAGDALVSLGLPHMERDGVRHYEKGDLHYLGMRLGSAAGYRLATRMSARALERLDAAPRMQVRVQLVAPDAAGATVELRLPGGSRTRAVARGDEPLAELELELATTRPRLSPALTEVLDRIGAFDFCLLPHRCRDGTRVARDTGLAECSTAAQMLIEDAEALGHRVRRCEGLLVSLPYSTEHSWAEVEVDGAWEPFDPLLIGHLRRFGGLDPARLPAWWSFAGALIRFGVQEGPIAAPIGVSDGRRVELTYLTSIAP